MKKLAWLSVTSAVLIAIMSNCAYSDLSNLNPVVAILKDNMPRLSKSTSDSIGEEIAKTGMKIEFVTAEQVSDPEQFNAEKYDLFVYTNGALNPIAIKKNLWNYLRYGGKMIVLGGPPFSDLCWQDSGKWVNMDSFLEQLSLREDKKIFFNFDEGNLTGGFKRETNNPTSPSEVKLLSPGAANTKSALEIEVANLTGWDQFLTEVKPGTFPDEDAATCLMAKGDENTGFLAIEWREDDGSRWINMIKLTNEWQYHVLSPNDFRYWPDSKCKGRGFKGDRFNPLNAKMLSFGLANDITPVGGGRHKFWIDEISSMSVGEYTRISKDAVKPIIYETLSPQYKLYGVSGITRIEKNPRQTIFPEIKWNLSGTMKGYLPISRITGEGFARTKNTRWIPLYDSYDQKKVKQGTPISIYMDWRKYKGSKWAYFAISDRDFYKSAEFLDLLKDVAVNMVTSPSLLCGGSDKFTYFANDNVLLGAKFVNPVKKSVNLTATINIYKGSSKVFSVEKSTVMAHLEECMFSDYWKPESKSGQYTVETVLTQDGRVIDTLNNQFTVIEDYPPIKDSDKITVKAGKFYLGSSRWNPVGINYWPTYVSGMEPNDYYSHWLNPKFYDPIEIEKDLELLEKMSMNVVSIQYLSRDHTNSLVDFLRRCGNHNIKANIFIASADPMSGNYSKKAIYDLISSARLKDCPHIFAYDIAWEPNMKTVWIRQEYDSEWNQWIDEQYGNKKNALKDWEYSPPVLGKRKMFSAPVDEQIGKDGEWRKMVIAYRRFIDDLTSRRYNSACRDIREIDPNHILGSRSGFGGNGMAMPEWFALDLYASAKHLDFISPEWYSLSRPEETIKAGFNTIYSYFVSNNKPVFWAEFGISVWDPITNAASKDVLEKQARYYNNFINMSIKSGCQGLACWWFPGGFRVDEKSDFGIFEQDRSPRPAVESMMKAAALFKEESVDITPKRFIEIDRYGSCLGYNDVFHRNKDAYLDAINSGEFPGLRTEGTGTDSTNTKLIAIGNVPFNGNNPLKYLNAEFNTVRISKDKINWNTVKYGDEIAVNSGQTYYLECSIGNTGEAEWVTPSGALETTGKVFLSSTLNSEIQVEQPILKNTKYFEDAEIPSFAITGGINADKQTVELRMTAKDRAQFGQKFMFVLVKKS